MMLEAHTLLNALAASLTPTTLAAVINDLAENDAESAYLAGLLSFASGRFREQLVCMVGDTQASALCERR